MPLPKKKVAGKKDAKKDAKKEAPKKESKEVAKKGGKKGAKKEAPKARSVSPLKVASDKSEKEPPSSEYLSRNEYDSLHEIMSMAD